MDNIRDWDIGSVALFMYLNLKITESSSSFSNGKEKCRTFVFQCVTQFFFQSIIWNRVINYFFWRGCWVTH